jgi:hypothetical protein
MKLTIKLVLFSSGLVFSLAYLSLAVDGFYRPSGPSKAYRKNASTAPVESISEIRSRKVARPNFDSDLDRLARMEQNYASTERLPTRKTRTRLARSRSTRKLHAPAVRKQMAGKAARRTR